MTLFPLSVSPSPAALRERCNALSAPAGRSLTPEDAVELLAARQTALQVTGRVDLGDGPLPLLAERFAPSPDIQREAWPAALAELQSLFYLCKGLSREALTDADAVTLLAALFDGPAHGSLTCTADLLPDAVQRFLATGQLVSEIMLQEETDDD